MPVITNDDNHTSWPAVVSQDVIRHIGTLKGDVFSFSGQVKGKTLLSLPQEADLVVKAVESEKRLVKSNYWASHSSDPVQRS